MYDLLCETQMKFENSRSISRCATNHKKYYGITGGCGLNVVFNYRLKKALPKKM